MTMEIEAKKVQLVRSILSIDSEEIINRLMQVVEGAVPSIPYTSEEIEELKKGLPAFMAQFSNDELISHEKIQRKLV